MMLERSKFNAKTSAALAASFISVASPTVAFGESYDAAVQSMDRSTVITETAATTMLETVEEESRQTSWAKLPDSTTIEPTYGFGTFPPVSTSSTRALAYKSFSKDEASLYEERGALIDKQFTEGLTQSEERKLSFVTWKLHRLQDARDGAHLDELAAKTDELVAFARQVSQLKAELLDKLPKRK